MGATLSEVAFEYKALWLQAGFYFLTTCWVYRWQILMSRKHAIERLSLIHISIWLRLNSLGTTYST